MIFHIEKTNWHLKSHLTNVRFVIRYNKSLLGINQGKYVYWFNKILKIYYMKYDKYENICYLSL